jgi:carboxypeptidase Q
MNRTAPRLFALLLVLVPALAPAEEPVDLEMVSRIRDEGLRRSQVMETARHLSDEIGFRVTGSPALKKANEWTREKLAEWGLQNAHLEPYHFGPGWSYTRGVLEVLRPYELTLLALPKTWTPGTDAGPIRGTLMIVSIESEKDFEQYRGKLAGKILLTSARRDPVKDPQEIAARRYTPDTLDELWRYQPSDRNPIAGAKRRNEMVTLRRSMNKFIAEEKALATIDSSHFDWGIVRAARGGSPEPEDGDYGLPGVLLSVEEYNRLHRLVSAGREIEVALDIRARFHTEDLNAYNTIAEIPGTDRKGEIVLAGAHLDSYQGGTGATDNAAGCAVMMEAVRILKVLGVKPRRTIRIALWSGEEQGMFGSVAYVAEHLGTRPKPKEPELQELPSYFWHLPPSAGPFQAKPEHARLSAYFNLDNGSGRIRGIYAQENAAVVPIFESWLRPLRDLEATTVTMKATGGSDHLPFDSAGIPAFQFIQDELDYEGRTWHSSLDVYDHLEEEDLKQASVVMATFLYHAAMRDEKLPRKHLP